MNWGWKIALFYIGFVVFMLTLVGLTMRERIDLVAPDYYQQELAYQQQIDAEQRARIGGYTLSCTPAREAVTLHLAPTVATTATGTVRLYRASDRRLDIELPLQLSSQSIMHISDARLQPGQFEVQVTWQQNGQQYIVSRSFFAP